MLPRSSPPAVRTSRRTSKPVGTPPDGAAVFREMAPSAPGAAPARAGEDIEARTGRGHSGRQHPESGASPRDGLWRCHPGKKRAHYGPGTREALQWRWRTT